MRLKSIRMVPKYTRGMSWLAFLSIITMVNQAKTQEQTYTAPDVNIFVTPDQPFNLPGSGDYIPAEEIRKYNFDNINNILRNTPGVYSREEAGFGIFPNISLRGVNTLRSAAITMMEDEINIAPAPYSAPDAYYSPLAGKMHSIEVLKGTSQFRYGPHTTGGVINYQTTPVELGEKYYLRTSYGSFNDKVTHAYANYGISGGFGAVAILGEVYYRENDGFHDFNIEPGTGVNRKGYGSDDAGGLMQFNPMVKLLWQLPTTMNNTLEIKASYNALDYNEGYAGLTTADFNADPYQRYVASQLDQMNSNAYTYYAKFRSDFNSNVSNNLTLYYNGFYRDWFKLSKVNGRNQQEILSKANPTAGNLNIFKGLAAGNITYKNNDRQYQAFGIQNETDFKFNTDLFGKNIGHDFKFGFKYHYDKINRDQQTHTFTQAVGGQLTGVSVAQADDRNERTEGYALYFEEAATINNFVVSFGSRLEFLDQHYRDKAATMGTTSNLTEETWAFVPGGGLLYNHDENWQWFAGVYKGFNTAGPSASRDDGSPLQPEKSIAKEIGVRYGDNNLAMSVTGFHTDFKDVIVIDNTNAGGSPDNGGNVVSKGLELSTVYSPENLLGVGDISFFANYTFTNANLDGDSTTTDTESIFAGGRDGSNVPYIPEHVLSFGADYEINKFDFGINMTYHSETYGTAEETETEESIGSANARAGRIDSAFLLNLRAGYKINDNYKVITGVNNATDLEYISSRHPTGARAGAPLTAYIKAVANFDSLF